MLESTRNHHPPLSVEKLSYIKPTSGAKKVGDCSFRVLRALFLLTFWSLVLSKIDEVVRQLTQGK